MIQAPSIGRSTRHHSPHISTNKYAKVGGREDLAINPTHLISLHPIFASLLELQSPQGARIFHTLLELPAGIPKRPPHPGHREIYHIVYPQTPHPPCWRNSLVGGQVRQYVLRARGETTKCARDAASREHEQLTQEPFEG